MLAVLGTALGTWLVAASIGEFAERVRLFGASPGETWRRAKHLPRAVYGMTIAHAGAGVVILGIVVSVTWETERLQVVQAGESVPVGGYEFTFRGVEDVKGPNYDAVRGIFDVTRDGDLVTVMTPETRTYDTSPQTTTEAAIHPTLTSDLYAVIGDPDGSGGWAARLYHKPLVNWIWLGAILVAVGGIVSLTDRRHRVGAPRRKARRAESGTARAARA